MEKAAVIFAGILLVLGVFAACQKPAADAGTATSATLAASDPAVQMTEAGPHNGTAETTVAAESDSPETTTGPEGTTPAAQPEGVKKPGSIKRGDRPLCLRGG